MSSNPRSIIKGAHRAIGKIGRGMAMSDAQAADGLELLNQLIASWKGEGLTMPFRTTETFSYSGLGLSSKISYTIGAGGEFDTVRPSTIEAMFHRDTSSSDYVMRPMTMHEFNTIDFKNVSTYPERYYYEAEYPLGKIHFDYEPRTNLTLHLVTIKEITAFADLTTTIDLPAEYDRALRTNLAVELAPDYGATVSQELMYSATESKANLKRLNNSNRPNTLAIDIGLQKGNTGNIYNGYN